MTVQDLIDQAEACVEVYKDEWRESGLGVPSVQLRCESLGDSNVMITLDGDVATFSTFGVAGMDAQMAVATWCQDRLELPPGC